MMNKVIKTFRKGAHVRYIGNNESTKEAWKGSVQEVVQRTGTHVSGYFPMRYGDGSFHACRYSVPIKELEIVIRKNGEWVRAEEV